LANVLCVLASARSKGYTATLLDSVIDGVKTVEGVEVEMVKITDYLPISPCMSCWNCARLYPFMWSGELNGLPFASLSQAANNGGTRMADREMAKWAFTRSFWYIGGLPVHMVQYEDARIRARYLGRKLAEAALGAKSPRLTSTWGQTGTPGTPLMCTSTT
jgi:hypothetical protein